MRFFIALEIPDDSKEQLQHVQQKLQDLMPDIRLVDPDKLHITLAFLGEQDESFKEKLVTLITTTTQNIPPFVVAPAYLDGFPNLHRAHVLWVGLKGDIDKLLLIRERVKDGLEELRVVVDERRYTPHITVAKTARTHRLSESEEAAIQELMSQKFDPLTISSIKLFESLPEGGFHRHNTLAEIKLTQKD
jgi:2'-5' RNA ligase